MLLKFLVFLTANLINGVCFLFPALWTPQNCLGLTLSTEKHADLIQLQTIVHCLVVAQAQGAAGSSATMPVQAHRGPATCQDVMGVQVLVRAVSTRRSYRLVLTTLPRGRTVPYK